MSTEKQKRGRKAKKEEENIVSISTENVTVSVATENDAIESASVHPNLGMEENQLIFCSTFFPEVMNETEKGGGDVEADAEIPKKRGRKPKGGKIIQQVVATGENKMSKPNVILHLKCSLKDINGNSAATQSNIQSFNFETNKTDLSYEIITNDESTFTNPLSLSQRKGKPPPDGEFGPTRGLKKPPIKEGFGEPWFPGLKVDFSKETSCDEETEDYYKKDSELKDIWNKLKSLEQNLHVNNISDKKSGCFWCTCEFDNPPIYIPKSYMKETYNVYGCFCSPECAVAHLMEENIDSSARFERYHMLNHIYTKVYNYTKNIKPAPNPYYMLDKFYGNLSIQEYRSLLRSERLFLVVDKPLTRILPELHEDNDDFIINNKVIPSNTYQIKKKVQRKQQSKNTILNEKFGF